MAYELAAKNYKPGAINRVILLSDGEANVGATGPDSISRPSMIRVRRAYC